MRCVIYFIKRRFWFWLGLNKTSPIFSSARRSPTMRPTPPKYATGPQQDFSRSFLSCCCPLLLSCSFLVLLGLISHYLSTSLVVVLCFLFPPLVHTALLPEVYFPPSLLRAQTIRYYDFHWYNFRQDNFIFSWHHQNRVRYYKMFCLGLIFQFPFLPIILS